MSAWFKTVALERRGDTTEEVSYQDWMCGKDILFQEVCLAGKQREWWCFSQGEAWHRGFMARMGDSCLADGSKWFLHGTCSVAMDRKAGLSKMPSTQNLTRHHSGLCKICSTSKVSISLNFVSHVPCSTHLTSKVGWSCCRYFKLGRGLVRLAGWEQGCESSNWIPSLSILERSHTPPSFCQKHLYVHTCSRLVWIQICVHRTVEWSWALGTDGWKAL